MANDPKDTIYIDPEDEITTVIDKVTDSSRKVVALVLPSRATVFQSVVNMKLLKRKGTEAGKDIVLVTNEASLLPLAGSVGLHVAKTLSSKPEIPMAPVISSAMVEAAEDDKLPDNFEPSESNILKNMAKEEITPKPTKFPDNDLGPIELDNTDTDSIKPTDTAMPAVTLKDKKDTKNTKKLKVPDFDRFRLIAILGGGTVVILIVLWFLMFKVWPHATIDIKTNAQNVAATSSFNLDTSSSNFNQSSAEVPAKVVSETKTYTATVNSTGSENNGQHATGTIVVSAGPCTGTQPNAIPDGTGSSSNNLTYIIGTNVTFAPITSNHQCTWEGQSSSGSPNIPITAQNGGSNYNLSNVSFTIPGYSGVGSGSASGGTDDIVTVVSQQDITNAQNNISTNTSGAKSDLINELDQSNYYPINTTFQSATPSISPNAPAGTAASSVTVTESIKYTMYGAIKKDIITLLNNNILSQVGKNQNILNNGFSSATYVVGSTPTSLTISSNAVVGPNINSSALKNEIKGLKIGAIESLIKSNSNVSSVTVTLSPFYVSTAPGPSHITINIAKPTNSTDDASH